MAFLGKDFYLFFICFLKVQLYLCQFICFFISQSTFLSYYFAALNIFQGFSLNFARILERAVDKLLNGSSGN